MKEKITFSTPNEEAFNMVLNFLKNNGFSTEVSKIKFKYNKILDKYLTIDQGMIFMSNYPVYKVVKF